MEQGQPTEILGMETDEEGEIQEEVMMEAEQEEVGQEDQEDLGMMEADQEEVNQEMDQDLDQENLVQMNKEEFLEHQKQDMPKLMLIILWKDMKVKLSVLLEKDLKEDLQLKLKKLINQLLLVNNINSKAKLKK